MDSRIRPVEQPQPRPESLSWRAETRKNCRIAENKTGVRDLSVVDFGLTSGRLRETNTPLQEGHHASQFSQDSDHILSACRFQFPHSSNSAKEASSAEGHKLAKVESCPPRAVCVLLDAQTGLESRTGNAQQPSAARPPDHSSSVPLMELSRPRHPSTRRPMRSCPS